MAYISDYVEVEIEITPKKLLEAYDNMTEDQQDQVLGDLEEHFEQAQSGDMLEITTCKLAESCNLSVFDHQKVNQYLARYGFKMVRTI